MVQSEPPWNWTGVDVLNFKDEDARLRELVAVFPSKRSSDDEIAAYLVDLGAHFRRWLHQDEFGPDRRQRTATIRALMKSIQRLEKHLTGSSSLTKGRLDAELRYQNNSSNLVMQALYEAAVDVAGDQRCVGAFDRDTVWASRLRDYAYTLLAQSQSIDSNTESEIFPVAQRLRFDALQATGPSFGLADVERWLHGYWNAVAETLEKLSTRRGAEERVSLKLLVERLCELWERETGCSVTVHDRVKDQSTGRAETPAGRFVTKAVEAVLPDQSWFKERAQFAQSARARSFYLDNQADEKARARHVLVIMKDFVHRRRQRDELHKK
jgi:hypothetical protein